MHKIGISLLLIIGLAACAPHPGQTRYNMAEAGKAVEIEEAVVTRAIQVAITGQTTGAGSSIGMLSGAGAGVGVGSGNGQIAAVIAGAVIGAIAGEIIEQEARNTVGIEYHLKFKNGKRKTIVQHQHAEDVVFKTGDKVLVQSSGSYQRVIPYE